MSPYTAVLNGRDESAAPFGTKHFGSALSRDEIRRFAANFALSLAIAEAEESAK